MEVAMSESEAEVMSVASGNQHAEKSIFGVQGGRPVCGLRTVHDGGWCFHPEMR